MNEYITKENLDDVIVSNKAIKAEIDALINRTFSRYASPNVKSNDALAYVILRDFRLIQLPIDDPHWGGAVYIKEGLKIPIINTSQPRVFQYFVAWHEIYHLLFDDLFVDEMHNISIDMDLNERKANLYAASMLLGNVYGYFRTLEDDEFLDRVMRCINVFKAPYKAVLIALYEGAIEYKEKMLAELVKEHFDNKPANMDVYFVRLGLDPELVKPSRVINFGELEATVAKTAANEADVSYHKYNLNFLKDLKAKLEGGL